MGPIGDEHQVNTTITGAQLEPQVAMNAAGSSVVVWTSAFSPGDDDELSSIQAQRYDADGEPAGAELQVNSTITGAQEAPDVAMDENGAFVVVWTSPSSPGDDNQGLSIVGRRFDADGAADGTDFQVNSTILTHQVDPSVAMAPDGSFVVAWGTFTSPGDDVSPQAVLAQRFDTAGDEAGSEFQVNTTTDGNQSEPSVAMGGDGSFVVAFASDNSPGDDASGRSVLAKLFDADGIADGDDFQVNTTTSLGQDDPSAGMDEDGDFLIAWTSASSSGDDASQESVLAQRYDAAGAEDGGELQVNTSTTGSQRLPDVAVAADGDAAITWTSASSAATDTAGDSVQMRGYEADGSAATLETQVNTTTTGDQSRSAVAMSSGFELAVAWQSTLSPGDDEDATSILGQRFGNSPPELDPIGPKAVAEGEQLTFDVDGDDPDDDPLAYSASDLPAGATFNDPTFDWTPTLAQAGSYDVTFEVSDGDGGTDSEVVTITVSDAGDPPADVPPLLDPRCANPGVICGTNGPDVLVGTSAADIILGFAGDDVCRGLGGNDLIVCSEGDDLLVGGGGKDTLISTSGNDVLKGGGGKDRLKGGGGKDLLVGGGGKDNCKSGPGKDRLKGCEKGR